MKDKLTHQVIRINRAQALAVADLLKTSPASALYALDQTTFLPEGTNMTPRQHLYLHDRDLTDRCVMISRRGQIFSLDSEDAF